MISHDREGASDQDAYNLAKAISASGKLAIRGLATHFCCPRDGDATRKAHAGVAAIRARLASQGKGLGSTVYYASDACWHDYDAGPPRCKREIPQIPTWLSQFAPEWKVNRKLFDYTDPKPWNPCSSTP